MHKLLIFSFACAATSAAWAQEPAGASDPQTRVPATQYRSVFKDTPTGVERETQDWKKANAEVGQFLRGHLDLLKLEEQGQAAVAPTPLSPGKTPPAATTPATPATPGAPAAQPAAPGAHKH